MEFKNREDVRKIVFGLDFEFMKLVGRGRVARPDGSMVEH